MIRHIRRAAYLAERLLTYPETAERLERLVEENEALRGALADNHETLKRIAAGLAQSGLIAKPGEGIDTFAVRVCLNRRNLARQFAEHVKHAQAKKPEDCPLCFDVSDDAAWKEMAGLRARIAELEARDADVEEASRLRARVANYRIELMERTTEVPVWVIEDLRRIAAGEPTVPWDGGECQECAQARSEGEPATPKLARGSKPPAVGPLAAAVAALGRGGA